MTAELPKQVQAQLEEAQRIQQSLAQPAPQPDPTPAPEPEPQPEPVVEPQPPQPAPAVPVEPTQDALYWQSRFKTLEGMQKAEAARFQAQIQALSGQLDQVRQQPQAPAQPEKPLVTSQDDDKFGSDLIDVMRRVVREESRVLLGRLQAVEEIARKTAPQMERIGQVEAAVTQTREERFWGELQNAVPDWEKINQDQRWITWLAENDPVAGCTRQEALSNAQARMDIRRVVALFKLFKETLPKPAPTPKTPNPELARQVAPSKTSTVAVPPTQDRKYTGRDYEYWFDPRRANDSEPAQVLAMKAELDRAYLEGRIQW
jgi:hypothetical protein